MNERETKGPRSDSGTGSSSSGRRSEKIDSRHLDRLAVVYVRQSTPQQVARHQESTDVQYKLKTRAMELGWPEDRVVVIDDDLGKSATTTEGRLGFQQLVSEVALDHVGIILGIEMSRLARSCKDWYQLLELCGTFATLLADLDGIYDPGQYNDGLLLGLKGTMSAAEVHILRQRMMQGRLNKAQRGEFISHVPIGYVRRLSGEVTLETDEQAREVVHLIFKKFDELGTLNALLQFLVLHKIQVPVRVRTGDEKGELEWHRPNRMTLQNILRHPMYAGAYTHGRRAVDPRRKVAGKPGTGRTVVPPEECQVFLKDRFPFYISWEQFDRNRRRLQGNRSVSDCVGAPKHGPAVLSGLVVCGKCGCRMGVRYGAGKGKHTYWCGNLKSNYGEPYCQSLAGVPLDAFVTKEALRLLEPASLELSLDVARNIERQRQELDSVWKKRLERACYEADRAARSYHHVEPENRLVARQLEQDWEQKLRERRELEEEYSRFVQEQPRVLSEQERDVIRRLAHDIPMLWNSSQTTPKDRKEILRQVINRVVVQVVGTSERVQATIEWADGTDSQHELIRPVARLEQLSYWPDLVSRLRDLTAEGLSAAKIAERINAEGWRPPKRCERFSESAILNLIHRAGLRSRRSRPRDGTTLRPHEWWFPTLAKELDMPATTLYSWLRRGWLTARRVGRGRWALWADAKELERLRELRHVPPGYYTRRHWTESVVPGTST